MKYQLNTNLTKKSIILGCTWNIWMICSELNCFFYDPSPILQLSEFVWTLHSSVWVVLNNFLFIDAKDTCEISSSNHHQIFFYVSLYPHLFFANTPCKVGGGRYAKENWGTSPPLAENSKFSSFTNYFLFQRKFTNRALYPPPITM